MRWRILALLFLARVGLGFQFQTVASVGDDLIETFALDHAEIGLLIGLFMAPGLFLALPAGYWGSFVSDKTVSVVGLCILAVGGFTSSFATESWVIGFGRVLAGAGFLLNTLYFTKMIADWFDGREIATAMSIVVMSWPFGIAMGQIGHAWLASNYGWQLPFQAGAIYCLVAAVGIFFFYETPPDLATSEKKQAASLTSQEWRMTLCAAAAWAVFNGAYVIYLSFGPKVLVELGHTTIAAAGIISIGSWVMILSGAVCGRIVDRFGRRNLVLSTCMGAAVLSLLMLGLPGAGVSASLLFGLLGMAPAGVIMAMAGQAMRAEARAFGTGAFFTVYYAIMLITPPVAGTLLDATGSLQSTIALAIAMFGSVVGFAFAFGRIKSSPAS